MRGGENEIKQQGTKHHIATLA